MVTFFKLILALALAPFIMFLSFSFFVICEGSVAGYKKICEDWNQLKIDLENIVKE